MGAREPERALRPRGDTPSPHPHHRANPDPAVLGTWLSNLTSASPGPSSAITPSLP